LIKYSKSNSLQFFPTDGDVRESIIYSGDSEKMYPFEIKQQLTDLGFTDRSGALHRFKNWKAYFFLYHRLI